MQNVFKGSIIVLAAAATVMVVTSGMGPQAWDDLANTVLGLATSIGMLGVQAVLMIAMFAGCAWLYFLPTLTAEKRHLKNARSILIVNLLFGWTLIGWGLALAWASAGTAEVQS